MSNSRPEPGAARRILAAAVDRHARTGFPLRACVELAATALKSDLGVSVRTFAKSASHARALADYGAIGNRPVIELAAALDPAADDYKAQVAGLVDGLDLDMALYRRREERIRPPAFGPQASAAVEAMPYPFYICDASGVVTFVNAACADFFGRSAQIGVDRWHVAWRLFTISGERVPFDRCAMALALRERRTVCAPRFVERPDGSRIRAVAVSTPILGPDGELLGGMNMMLARDTVRAPLRRREPKALSVQTASTEPRKKARHSRG